MPQVHFVKKARKDNSAVKKGQPYYWWQFPFGPKHYSKTRPRQSQLTQSSFLSSVYALQEEIEDITNAMQNKDDFADVMERIDTMSSEVDDLRDGAQDSLDNMPEGLQDSSPNGEKLQARIEFCEALSESLSSAHDDLREFFNENEDVEWDDATMDEATAKIDDVISGVDWDCE